MTAKQDLQERWAPSPTQVESADEMLLNGWESQRADGNRGVYTLHLLINKQFGWWTPDVQVFPIEDAVLTSRNDALRPPPALAQRYAKDHGVEVTGGYTWHSQAGEWAVFEDICSGFTEDGEAA